MDKSELDEQGYTVVRGAVGEALLAPLRALARDEAGLDLDDPATWPDALPAAPTWGHQAQWDIRQHPPIHAAFAAAYGQDELWVSQDALGVHVPGMRGLPIHWDIDPRDEMRNRMLQGVLYVTDVGPGQAPFTCVPELFRDPPSDPPETWGIDVGGAAVVDVLGSAGDLIIFDGRLPHGRAVNTSDRPRIAQYVTMWPPGSWGEDAAVHQDVWQTGRAFEGFRNKPGWDRVEPWPPAQLTPLGRSLLGLSPR